MKTELLFDLDGTLLNTLQDLADATNYALAQFRLPARTLEEVRTFVGNGAARLIDRALPGLPSDPPAQEVLAVFQTYYRANCQVATAAYEGIPEVLEALGKHYPMAIVSNKPDLAVKRLCAQYFPGIYARGESTDCPRKPAPDMVFRAMEALGADRCIYIGDSEVDVLTAKNAGIPCLSVLWGFRGREEIAAAGGKFFCEKPELLPQKIQEILGELHGK